VEIDDSAAQRLLGYVDGEYSLTDVWTHPGYGIVREQAELLGSDLTPAAVERAVAGEESAFGGVERLDERRREIRGIIRYVRSNEAAWTEEIERSLERVAPEVDLSDVTVHLGIGGQMGIGLEDGAYLNVPLVLDHPRQLLYTCIHESAHVCYEREHGARAALGPDPLGDPSQQLTVFETVVHSEAFATYAPLALRRADGNVGGHDHPTCEDYRVLDDDDRLRRLVDRYDAVRERLRAETVPRETLAGYLFGEPRLPYRVGCALLDELADRRGRKAARTAFATDPGAFCAEYDGLLDRYRA